MLAHNEVIRTIWLTVVTLADHHKAIFDRYAIARLGEIIVLLF